MKQQFHLVRRVLAIGLVAGGAELAGVPAGPLLGALAVTIVGNLRTSHVPVPPWLLTAALAVLGWNIGSTVTMGELASVGSNLGTIAALLGTLALVAALLAVFLARRFGWSSRTVLLACAPGGLAELGRAVTMDGVEVEPILAVHVLRVVAMATVLPLAVTLLAL